MQPPVDTALIVPAVSPNRSRIAWSLVALRCLCFLWFAAGFTRILPIFSQLFASLGLHLPPPTRFLLSSPLWFLPVVFIFGAILTLARNLVNFSKLQLRVINVFLILIAGVLPLAIIVLMYLPLFLLIGKLKGAH